MSNRILQRGDILSNDELQKHFKCGNSGGMRKANLTNSLIVICDHSKSLYDDRWSNGILFYTGMGQAGNQSLNYLQNKTLANANTNGVTLHLFEVFEQNKYLYQGEAKLADLPFEEEQIGSDKKIRKVWIFPLALLEGSPILPEEEEQEKLLFKALSKTSIAISDTELKKLVETKPPTLDRRKPTTKAKTHYYRDPNIVLYALRRAKGICELCNQPAPFITKDGLPFLEVHHIVYLSKGGADSIFNVSSLCPNCHRQVHALENKNVVKDLLQKATVLLKG